MKKIRTFIAFPISAAVKQEMADVVNRLKKDNKISSVKWTEAKTAHLTLYFIGDLTETQVERVKAILGKATAGVAPIKFSLHSLDAFPNQSRPRVITIRVWEEGREARKLRQRIVSGLNRACITGDDKPWKPHLTLGRNRTDQALRGLDREVENIEWTAQSVELIASELTPDGPHYTVLDSFPLN